MKIIKKYNVNSKMIVNESKSNFFNKKQFILSYKEIDYNYVYVNF